MRRQRLARLHGATSSVSRGKHLQRTALVEQHAQLTQSLRLALIAGGFARGAAVAKVLLAQPLDKAPHPLEGDVDVLDRSRVATANVPLAAGAERGTRHDGNLFFAQ